MSCDIRRYIRTSVREGWSDEASEMVLTAFVGPKNDRCGIQFSIGNRYIMMNHTALMDLIKTIANRCGCKKGWKATDWERKNIDFPIAWNDQCHRSGTEGK